MIDMDHCIYQSLFTMDEIYVAARCNAASIQDSAPHIVQVGIAKKLAGNSLLLDIIDYHLYT